MSPKTSHDDIEELVSRFVRHAGYTRPTPLQSTVVPLVLQGRDLLVESEHGEGKTGAMIMPLLAVLRDQHEATIKAVILTGSPDQVERIHNQYRRFAPRNGHRPSLVAVGNEEHARRELRTLRKHTDILLGTPDRIIDHIRRDNISLADVEYAVLDVPDDVNERGFDKDVQFIFSKMRGVQQTVAFLRNLGASSAFESILKRPQTISRTSWTEGDTNESTREEEDVSDTERFGDSISTLIKRVKEGENPEVLNHYRKIFRRNIPLHLRGYVAAMLLKDVLGGDEPPSSSGSGSGSGGFKTLFVSIGKNRRVFPKDLVKFFADALGIDQSGVGNVKILDSYSFVDIPELYADRAIQLLNNSEFHGRKITVNHARKKRK